MHTTSGRWQYGLFLSVVTAVLWGLLPIALKGLLQYTDVFTITWYRFVIASVFLGGFLVAKSRIPDWNLVKNKTIAILVGVVLIGLLGNYILYMIGLDMTTPGAAQVMIQSAPMLLLLGGLWMFKEQFTLAQWIGLGIFWNHVWIFISFYIFS